MMSFMHRCDGAWNFIIIRHYKLYEESYPQFSHLLLEIERKHFYVLYNYIIHYTYQC